VTIERYKARLVAKGLTQTYGVDYLETLSIVAKMNTVRVMSLAANHDWDLQQFDVKNAFLHGDLEEEIYMNLPPCYDGQVDAGTVCTLKNALYELKQSPKSMVWKIHQSYDKFRLQTRSRSHFTQQKYITDFLKETRKTTCEPVSTPVDPNIKLGSVEEDNVVNKEMYQRRVDKVIYLSHTIPDIAFPVSLVRQFMHQPNKAHL